MSLPLKVLTLCLFWTALTGTLDAATLVTGFIVSLTSLWLTRQGRVRTRVAFNLIPAISLLFYFIWQLILSNLRVAWDVVTPTHHMRPGFIAIPLDATTDVEIAWLANLITLTPGTLSIDVSTDRKVLYIYAMYISDAEVLRQDIKQGFERRVLGVWR